MRQLRTNTIFSYIEITVATILLVRNTVATRRNNNDRITYPEDDFLKGTNSNAFTNSHIPPDRGSYFISPRRSVNNNSPQNYDFVTQFSWNLFKGSKTPLPLTNIIESPILIQLILSQLEEAAAGSTKEQISNTILNADAQTMSQLISKIQHAKLRNEVALSSAIFTTSDLKLNESFVAQSRKRNVNVFSVDFNNPVEASYHINRWVENATKNMIHQLFSPEKLDGLRLLLTNSLYFRGFWANPFDKIADDTFFTSEKLRKNVPFMKQLNRMKADQFALAAGPKGTWVEIPYEGNDFSMLIIVPEEDHTLDKFIAQMSATDLTTIINQLDSADKRMVLLRMPRFSVQTSVSLVNSLLKLGLVDVFTTNSNLPYLTKSREYLKIDNILQQCVLNVDETGSVAAAATSVSVVTLSINYDLDDMILNIDKPFLSVIVDKKYNLPLFLAKIYEP